METPTSLLTDSAEANRALVRGASLTSLAAVAGILLDFLAFVLAARSVAKPDFGVFVLFLVLGGFARVAADFGLRQTLVHSLSSEQSGRGEIFRSLLAMQTLVAALVAGGVVLLAAPLRRWILPQNPLPHFTLYLGLFVLAQAWHQCFSGALQGLRLFRRYVAGELTRSLLRLLLFAVLVLWLGQGLRGLIVSTIAAVGMACLVQWFLIPLPKRLSVRRLPWRRTARFAVPLGLNGLLGVTFDRINRLILAACLGPAAVALLETAARVPDASIQVYMGFQSAFFPSMSSLFAAKGKDAPAKTLAHSLRFVALVVAFVAIIAFALRCQIMVLLFSQAYAEAAWGFAILMASLAIALVNNVLHTTLIASGNSRSALYACAFQGAVSVLLYLAIIPSLGYMGAIYAYVAGNLLVNPLLVWLLGRQQVRVDVGTYLKPIALLLFILAQAALASPGVVFLAAGLAQFFAGCVLLKCATREDARFLGQLLPVRFWRATVEKPAMLLASDKQ